MSRWKTGTYSTIKLRERLAELLEDLVKPEIQRHRDNGRLDFSELWAELYEVAAEHMRIAHNTKNAVVNYAKLLDEARNEAERYRRDLVLARATLHKHVEQSH